MKNVQAKPKGADGNGQMLSSKVSLVSSITSFWSSNFFVSGPTQAPEDKEEFV